MRGEFFSWVKRVAIATAVLTAIGVFAGSGRAMAADGLADAGSTMHAAVVVGLAWLLSGLRVRRRGGHVRFGFELSPVSRVRAASTVHQARLARTTVPGTAPTI